MHLPSECDQDVVQMGLPGSLPKSLPGSLHRYQMGLCLGRKLEIGPEGLAFSGRFFMTRRQMTWMVQETACYHQPQPLGMGTGLNIITQGSPPPNKSVSEECSRTLYHSTIRTYSFVFRKIKLKKNPTIRKTIIQHGKYMKNQNCLLFK